MQIRFATRKLEKTFNEAKKLQAEYGQNRAAKIMLRMPVLANARCLADVPTSPPLRCHQLTEDRDETFAVVVGGNWRLLFEPADDPIPRGDDGGIDKAKVTSIRILGVEVYHGS